MTTRIADNRPMGDWAMKLGNELFGVPDINLHAIDGDPTTGEKVPCPDCRGEAGKCKDCPTCKGGGCVPMKQAAVRRMRLSHDEPIMLSLGMDEYEVLRLGDVAGHEFHGNQYGAVGIHGAKTREFLKNDLRPGNNIISVAHRKVFSAANGELVKKHRGIQPEGAGGEHPNKGKKTEELYPQGVTREAVGRFHVGFNYERNVQAQQAREGKDMDFEKQPMWVSKAHPEGAGQHDPDNPQIIKHVDTGREYLQLRPHTDAKGNVRREHEQWRDNATGRVLPAEEVKDLKKNLLQGGNSKPKAAEQGGIEKKIPVRAIPLEDVYALRASKEKGWKNINQAAHDEAGAEPVRLSHDLILAKGGANIKPCRGTMCALMKKHDADCDKWDAKDAADAPADKALSRGDLTLGDVAGHEFHGNQYTKQAARASVASSDARKASLAVDSDHVHDFKKDLAAADAHGQASGMQADAAYYAKKKQPDKVDEHRSIQEDHEASQKRHYQRAIETMATQMPDYRGSDADVGEKQLVREETTPREQAAYDKADSARQDTIRKLSAKDDAEPITRVEHDAIIEKIKREQCDPKYITKSNPYGIRSPSGADVGMEQLVKEHGHIDSDERYARNKAAGDAEYNRVLKANMPKMKDRTDAEKADLLKEVRYRRNRASLGERGQRLPETYAKAHEHAKTADRFQMSHGDLVLGPAPGHPFFGNQYAGGESGAAVGAKKAAERVIERAQGQGKVELRSDVRPGKREEKSYGRAEKKIKTAVTPEEHEHMRILTMNDRDLATRINKIKNKDKLERFVAALKRVGKHDLAKAASERLLALSRGEDLPLIFSGEIWTTQPAVLIMAERMAAAAK